MQKHLRPLFLPAGGFLETIVATPLLTSPTVPMRPRLDVQFWAFKDVLYHHKFVPLTT